MARKLTSASQFFDDCKSSGDPKAFIHKLVTDAQAENDWLDFKRHPGNDGPLKAMWFEGLSGFANSGGGVLLWGVDASKNAEGIDAASGFTPITVLGAFESKLREFARHGTNPPVANIEYFAVEESSNTGFLLCLVPEGAYKPYRSEAAGKQFYYIRAGDSFQAATTAILRQLFYPQSKARFWIEVTVHCSQSQRDKNLFEVSCPIRLHNDGNATASGCVVLFQTHSTGGTSIENFDEVATRLNTPTAPLALKIKDVIHPGFTLPIGSVCWKVDSVTAHQGSGTVQLPNLQEVKISLIIYARDMEPQRFDVEFDPDVIQHTKSGIQKAYPLET